MSTFEIYTDGACSGNPGPGGWGMVVVGVMAAEALNPVKILIHQDSGGEKATTNNRMEMMGAVKALEYIQAVKGVPNEYTIVTDSQYVKKGLTEWLPGWKRKDWKTADKKPVKNQDLWKILDSLYTQLPGVNLRWVKGHSGEEFNEMVDQLAVKAIPGGLPQAGPQ